MTETVGQYYSNIIKEIFLAYKSRQKSGTLYNDPEYPKMLLTLYYEQHKEDIDMNELRGDFIEHYVEGENLLENAHEQSELDGMIEMYNYVCSAESDYKLNLYTILTLHEKLFSKVPFPEAGGKIRVDSRFIRNTGIDCAPPDEIRNELKKLEPEVNELIACGPKVKENNELLFDYIDKCIVLKCKLIKIHPFADGNGRTIRAFINKLFIRAGIPPVYIAAYEHAAYRDAMHDALGEEKYDNIIHFYYYKVCDSIVELDINNKLRSEEISKVKIVKNLVNKMKAEITNYTDDEIYPILSNELRNSGIENTIYSTNDYNDNLDDDKFLIVYYTKNNENRKLLVDIYFTKKVSDGKVKSQVSPESAKIARALSQTDLLDFSNLNINDYISLHKERTDVLKPKTMV